MVAFYIACAAQLESPHWAWLTVWIVAQPTPGMVLSKSLYRVIGTVSGCILAIILISCFSQTPEFFVLALATIVGGCTWLSQMLTNFRAYATVLAGYTAGIVAADAINSPQDVFYIAMARSSCIIIGIMTSVVITGFFAPHRAKDETLAKIRQALVLAAKRAVYSYKADNHVRLQIGKELITRCIALDTLIEYAAAESASFRLQANNARSLIAHILGIVSARRALDAHLIRCGWPRHNLLNVFHEVIIDYLNEMPERLEHNRIDSLLDEIRQIRDQLKRLHPEAETSNMSELVSERFVIDRLEDLIDHIIGALTDWNEILHDRHDKTPLLTLNFHRDLRAARINALRAFVAVSATGAFWIASAWPDGPGALIFVAILTSLFAAHPNPDRVGWAFFKIAFFAALAALICKYAVLTSVANFETGAVVLGLFLIPMGLFMAFPRTNASAISFSLVFLNLTQPANPMTYDLAGSINTAVATLVGIFFSTVAYVLIYPPDPEAARAYVTYRIRIGLQLIAERQPIVPRWNWETRMYDRITRLNNPQNLSGTYTDEWLDAGLGALNAGIELIRLRYWYEQSSVPPELRGRLAEVITAFRHFEKQPSRAELELRKQLQEMPDLDPGLQSEHRTIWARIYGALTEMELYLAAHPRLLSKASLT